MRFILSLCLLAIAGFSTPIFPQGRATDDKLNAIFESIHKFEASPEDSLYSAVHPRSAWSSDSFEAQRSRAVETQKFVDRLQLISDGTLNDQDRISKTIMLIRLRDRIDAVNFKMILIPFNAEGGFYNNLASSTLQRLPFATTQNYFDYLAWLPRYDALLNENIALMKMGIREKIVAPKVIVRNSMELLKPMVVTDFHQSIFYEPFNHLPSQISESDRAKILQQSGKVIGKLTQTFQSLQKFFANEYMTAATETVGIGAVPNGKAYYANRILHYTTLPLSPDSIHKLGLSEVARIRASMDKIIKEVKFSGSFADFVQFLRTDPQFYAKTGQELLNYAAWLSKKAEGQLPKLFNTLYDLPFTVEPVPDAIAPTYTGGRYVPGSRERKRAGIYWVNTYDLKSRTLYTIPALTLHEAVPGHHLQGTIAAQLKNMPAFRNRYYISAFGEGWGLYSEFLGEEMGMYTTPYELFGRYTYEMWRACRLVVDTGIHDKGWTRDQALKYLSENTALSLHECTTEIDRYIGWPGQAVSYKIGEIKIKALRQKAEQVLGSKFQIGAFHDAVLMNGSVPLSQLEKQVEAFIAEGK